MELVRIVIDGVVRLNKICSTMAVTVLSNGSGRVALNKNPLEGVCNVEKT